MSRIVPKEAELSEDESEEYGVQQVDPQGIGDDQQPDAGPQHCGSRAELPSIVEGLLVKQPFARHQMVQLHIVALVNTLRGQLWMGCLPVGGRCGSYSGAKDCSSLRSLYTHQRLSPCPNLKVSTNRIYSSRPKAKGVRHDLSVGRTAKLDGLWEPYGTEEAFWSRRGDSNP